MIYAAFNEPELLTPQDQVTLVTDRGLISGVNRAAFRGAALGSTFYFALPTAITEGWVHVLLHAGTNNGASSNLFTLQNEEGGSLCTLSKNSAATLQITADAGGSATTAVTFSPSTQYLCDISFKLGSAGHVKVFINANLVLNYVGNVVVSAGTQSVKQARFRASDTNTAYTVTFSHVILSDECTLGARVYTLGLTTTADTTFTGTVANITGTGYATLASSVKADTAGKRLQVSHALPVLAASERVAAVVMHASAMTERAGGTSYIDPLFKYDGIYTESDSPLLLNDQTFAAQSWMYQNHPATSEPWTRDTFNATTIGLIAEYAE